MSGYTSNKFPNVLLTNERICGMLSSFTQREVYAWAAGGSVSHYRDATGHEVDAIIDFPDGRWGAFEVKMGMGAVEKAAADLRALAAKIDTAKTPAPSALCVITGNGFAHRRPDGVCVIPLATLRD